MRFDWDELHGAKGEGFLSIVAHPVASGEIFLLNYTDRAQYQRAWDRYPVLIDCRGTVVNVAGETIAKPFRKFFNVGEQPETQLEHLITLGAPEVTHKLDGSMCVLYPYEDGYRFTTRGSFTSWQSARATEIWETNYATEQAARLDGRLTYIFELVGPENRHVVRYDRENLVLIGVVVTETGQEWSYHATTEEARRLNLPHVDAESLADDWPSLIHAERTNFEGFVLFWPDHNRRVKIKLEEYVRLNRIISGLSEHVVWEHLRDGVGIEEMRAALPEEIQRWLDATTVALLSAHADLAIEVERVLDSIRATGLDPADRTQRKEVAQIVLRESSKVRPAVFLALDGKDHHDALWRLVEPRAGDPVQPPAEEQ